MAQRSKIGATPTSRKQTGKGSNGLCPRPSRPALRGGVTGGEPPLYPALKSNLRIALSNPSALPWKPCSLSVPWQANQGQGGPKTANPHNRPTAGQRRVSRPGGARMPPEPQEGHKAPHRGRHGENRVRAAPHLRSGPLYCSVGSSHFDLVQHCLLDTHAHRISCCWTGPKDCSVAVWSAA